MTFHPGSHLLNPDYLSSPDTPAQGSIGTWCGLPSGHPRRRKGARLRGLPSLRLLGELSLHLLHLRLHRARLSSSFAVAASSCVNTSGPAASPQRSGPSAHQLRGCLAASAGAAGTTGTGWACGGTSSRGACGIAVAAHLALALRCGWPLLLLRPSPSHAVPDLHSADLLGRCLAMTTCSCSGALRPGQGWLGRGGSNRCGGLVDC